MNDEGLHVEYKQEYTEQIKKSVVAFANTDGGNLYIGVNDAGQVVGIANPDDVLLQVTHAIRNAIKPDVTLFTSCDKDIIEGKSVVVVSVQKGTASPYYLAKKGIRPEGVYVRQGSSSVPATEGAILRMIQESAGASYEDARSYYQDLRFTTLQEWCKRKGLPFQKEQQKTLSIIGRDGLFTNLGLLVSEQNPHTIKFALFQGVTKEVFRDRFEFSGSVLQQLEECYACIDRYNQLHADFEGLERIDTKNYPPSAVREALLNAIVHRDYGYSGSTLISMFDDRIELTTIGGLVKGISKDDMLLGLSLSRNKHLANLFYRLQLIEAFGTGIPKIMESYEGFKPLPKIEVTDNAFKITLYNRFYDNPAKQEGLYEKSYNSIEPQGNYFVSDNSPGYYADKRYRTLNAKEQHIVELLASHESVQRKDVEQALGISQPMAVRYLRQLLDKGVIVKVGNGKNSKYQLARGAGRSYT